MKKRVFLGLGLAIILTAAYLGVSYIAVRSLQTPIRKKLGSAFVVREIVARPTHLSLKGIEYVDPNGKRTIFRAEEVRIYPELLPSLKGAVRVRECRIVKPHLIFRRFRDGAVTGPWAGIDLAAWNDQTARPAAREARSPAVRIDRIRLEKGLIEFIDEKPSKTGPPIRLEDLEFQIDAIEYPLVSLHSPIELKGKIPGGRDGTLHIKGWLDVRSMDMELALKARDIDVKILEPYYERRVSADVDSGYIQMESQIRINQMVFDAPGHLELSDLHIQEGGTVFWIPSKTFVSLLKNKGNRVKVPFQVKGRMDDPRFRLHEDFVTRVAISLAESLGLPVKVVGKTVLEALEGRGLSEDLKAIGDLLKKREKGK